MADSTSLLKAKKAKQDEFYTQYADIQTEMNAYLEFDRDVFRGKTVLLPCDDPEWSNFTRYFAENFSALGLKNLISTSYAPNAKTAKYGSLFEYAAMQNGETPKNERGRIFVLDHDVTGDGKVNFEDIEWTYLKGDGDFRSDEVKMTIATTVHKSQMKEICIDGYCEQLRFVNNTKMWVTNSLPCAVAANRV